MPQPFEQFSMDQLGSFSKEMFRNEARKINIPIQHGDLAHYLVNNFKSELSSDEHVVDTAIRLLKNKISSQPDSGEQLSAGRWVKASERLPSCPDTYFIRHIKSGKRGIAVFRNKIGKQSLFHRWPEKIEWLDESIPVSTDKGEDTHIMLNRLQEYGNRGRDEVAELKKQIEESVLLYKNQTATIINRDEEIERLKGLIKAVQLSATDVRHEGILISYVSYNNLISQQQG